MKSKFYRLLSVLLLVCMLASFAPAAYAEEPADVEEPDDTVSVQPLDEPVTYTLTLDANNSGRSSFAAKTVTLGQPIGELPWGVANKYSDGKCSYVLDGWNDAEGNNVTAETVYSVEGDSTIYARWVQLPGSSSTHVTNELFSIQCTTNDDHKWVVNWFGSHVKLVDSSVAWDSARGCWTASATFSNFSLINSTVTKKNYFGGMTHYYDKGQSITIQMYYAPNATGLNSQKTETTGLWLPDGEFVADVFCYDKPAAPSTTTVQKLDKIIWVHENGSFPDGPKATGKYVNSRKLIAGTYTLGEIYQQNGAFYCDLTITDLAPYVKAFTDKYGETYHIDTINSYAEYKYVLKYTGSTTDYKQDGTGWTVDASSYATNSEKLNGKSLWMTDKYTVTYTDGVEDEELFEDQVSYVLYGDETPAYEGGTPTRTNWVFKGWSPEVESTVTDDVTYVAQWEKATANKPTKKITATDVNKMQIRAYALGTEVINPFNEPYSATPTIKAAGVAYEIGAIEGNDVDGYTTTVTFHFRSGDKFEAAARTSFNTNKNLLAISGWKESFVGDWVYAFGNEKFEADQTLTLYWVTSVNPFTGRLTGSWRITSPVSGGLTNNITSAVANLIHAYLYLPTSTVTYTDGVEGVELFADQVYTANNGSTTPAFEGTPEREGYTFEGWDPKVAETVTEDVTYTAVWKAVEYTLPVDPANGEDVYDVTITYEDVVGDKLETPVWEGHTFTGWVDQDGEAVDLEAAYTEALESVTATWTLNKYSVPVNPANGQESYTVTCTYEDVVGDKLETPVWEGHTFTGWVDQDGKPVDLTATYTEDLTSITGTWKLNEYVVPVDPANGEDVTDVTYTYEDVIGDKYDFSKNPTRKGYTFQGWVDQDGNPVDLKATYTEDIQSINGSWKGKTYTVTFKLEEDEGTLSFTEKKVVNGDPLGYTPKVEREGYTFIGWYDEYGKYYNSETIFDAARDITLTGRWTKTIVPTGDDSDPALFALMMLGSLACAGAIILRLRKRKDEV